MADGSHAFSSKKLSGDGGCPWLLGGSTLDCIHQAPGRQHADLRRVLRDGGQSGPDMLCQAHARHIRPGTNLPEREGPVRLQPPGRPGRHNRRASGCKWAGLANAAGKGRLPGRGPVGNTHRFSATHGVPPTRRRPWPAVSGNPAVRDRAGLSMYIGNLPMPQGKRTVHQRLHPLKILGKHAGTAGISMSMDTQGRSAAASSMNLGA